MRLWSKKELRDLWNNNNQCKDNCEQCFEYKECSVPFEETICRSCYRGSIVFEPTNDYEKELEDKSFQEFWDYCEELLDSLSLKEQKEAEKGIKIYEKKK